MNNFSFAFKVKLDVRTVSSKIFACSILFCASLKHWRRTKQTGITVDFVHTENFLTLDFPAYSTQCLKMTM